MNTIHNILSDIVVNTMGNTNSILDKTAIVRPRPYIHDETLSLESNIQFFIESIPTFRIMFNDIMKKSERKEMIKKISSMPLWEDEPVSENDRTVYWLDINFLDYISRISAPENDKASGMIVGFYKTLNKFAVAVERDHHVSIIFADELPQNASSFLCLNADVSVEEGKFKINLK